MWYPYVTCPECGCQMLNPTIEDESFHFVCECGVEVWCEDEIGKEYK